MAKELTKACFTNGADLQTDWLEELFDEWNCVRGYIDNENCLLGFINEVAVHVEYRMFDNYLKVTPIVRCAHNMTRVSDIFAHADIADNIVIKSSVEDNHVMYRLYYKDDE